jgi:hypothetical protein
VLRIQSYTTAVYDRIAPCVIVYSRTWLSQLYNLMNSKYFNLFNLFFLLDRFVFIDEFDRMEGLGREAESGIEPVSWPVW